MRTAHVRLALFALPLLVLSAAPQPSQSPAPADTKARVDAIFAEYDRSDSPGCALGVYRDGRIEYARGYGMANLELGIANSPQTVLDIGSTGKQFTAFSIHLLARDGKLTLDDDVRKWIPEIPDYGKAVTIRHLLHHTGGLRDYIVLFDLQGVIEEDVSTREDTLAVLALQKAPNFAPGAEHLYSNTGYFLLGEIVRRASGKPLREFAQERIFGPLGMRHTQYNDSHGRIIPGRGTGYSKEEGGGFSIEMSDWEQVGDGGVQTTIEDLQRWDENFYAPRVGDAALIAAMLEPGVLNSGKKLQYASALYVSDYRGLPTVTHGGSWAGYRTQLMRFPRQHLSVACICNLAQTNPSRLAEKVSEVYLGGLMSGPAAAKTPEPSAAAKKPRSSAADSARLSALAGAYRNRESGNILELSVSGSTLEGRLGRRKVTLVPTGPDRYRLEPARGEPADVVADRAGAARPRLTILSSDGDTDADREVYEPVELWKPAARDLDALAGRYASAELDTTWRLEAAEGKLFIRHRGAPAEPLSPTVADTFALDEMVLVFAHDASGQPTGFTLDDGRVRGVAFRRLAAK